MQVEIKQLGSSSSRDAPLLILEQEQKICFERLAAWSKLLNPEFAFYVLSTPLPSSVEVISYTKELEKECSRLGLKRLTMCAGKAGSGLALNFAATSSRLIRRLLILDGVTRVFKTPYESIIDSIERRLPLGLPLRRLGKEFDSRSTLHRIHCPTLLLSSLDADSFSREQYEDLRGRIPNAWGVILEQRLLTTEDHLSEEVQTILNTFLEIPVKSPQKSKAKKSINQ